MRRLTFSITCLLLMSLAYSCQKKAPESTVVVVGSNQLQQQSGTDCDLADTLERTDCARIDLAWPKVEQGPDALKTAVDQWASGYLVGILSPDPEGQTAANPDINAAAKAFFTEHRNMEKSAMTGSWTAETRFKVLHNDGQYLTLEVTGYAYTGGAHGSTTAAVATFHSITGKRLGWDDLVTDKAEALAVAEQVYRDTRPDIFQPDNNAEAFEFDETTPFELARNFGLVQQGIYCHYIPYEVGPYAFGSTQMTIPFTDLGALAKIRSVTPSTSRVSPVPQTLVNTAAPTEKTATSTKKDAKKDAGNKPAAKTSKPAAKKSATARPAGPTVTLKQNGDILINGKNAGDLESLRKQLQATLLTYNTIPEKVNFNTTGQTGMGMRAEVRTIINESIAGAKWLRKKAAIEALNNAVGSNLDMETQLKLGSYRNSGAFAYISAQPLQTNGRSINYNLTDYADDSGETWFKNNVVGLLRYEKGAWKVLAYNIGLDKAPASTWTKKFGAPAGLFVATLRR